MPFRPLPAQVDLPALERETLARWESSGVFARSLEQTKDGFAGPGACKVNFAPQTRVGCLEGTMWKLVGKVIC